MRGEDVDSSFRKRVTAERKARGRRRWKKDRGPSHVRRPAGRLPGAGGVTASCLRCAAGRALERAAAAAGSRERGHDLVELGLLIGAEERLDVGRLLRAK